MSLYHLIVLLSYCLIVTKLRLAPLRGQSLLLWLLSEECHATRNAQAGGNGSEDGDSRLNNEFPSFFSHSSLGLSLCLILLALSLVLVLMA